VGRDTDYPLGASLSLDQLEADPHSALAELRAREPVSWVPCLGGWLVTRHDLAVEVMGDPERFTVDDPGFSTAQVIGSSMLSLDGEGHTRHRAPFRGAFRPMAVAEAFAPRVKQRARELIDGLEPHGQMELRTQFAGPLSAAVIGEVLGLGASEVPELLCWYQAIVASVTAITAGQPPPDEGATAYAALKRRLGQAIDQPTGTSLPATVATASRQDLSLSRDEIVANAAVLLFGGIETTEAMITTAALELLRRPELAAVVGKSPVTMGSIVDESLRLEPAAAMVDRYATTDCLLGSAPVKRGELVHVSIAGANRDPAVFSGPDRFDPGRPDLRRHLSFAQGPHVCLGVHLARLEARVALEHLLARLPGLRLDPSRPAEVQGLVFRKPPRLDVLWET
jgi:cytochrome P450